MKINAFNKKAFKMSLQIYKISTHHDNCYCYFKYIFLAPIALLRLIGILSTIVLSNYLFKYFPNLWNGFIVYLINKIIIFFCGFIQVKIKNKNNLNLIKGDCITVYNHTSFVDGFLLCTLYPFSFVVKERYAKFMKEIVKISNGIIIEKNGNNTQKIINFIKEKRGNLLIAPEGTCTNGKYLIKFNLGAFIPLAPIQPIVIHYHYKYFNPSFSQDNKFIVLYRLLTQFVNRVTFEVLPLQYPLIDETPKQFAERVRDIMAQALNVATLN